MDLQGMQEEIIEQMAQLDRIMEPLQFLDQFEDDVADEDEVAEGGGAVPEEDAAQAEPSSPKDDYEPSPVLRTPKGAEMKGLSCEVCYEGYNTTNRIPKVFHCGHSFCALCVKGLIRSRTIMHSTVSCPACRQNTHFTAATCPHAVPSNYCLLAMLEQQKEETKGETVERETLACCECGENFGCENVTMCNEEACQLHVSESVPKNLDRIKRPKCLLVCRSCISLNHIRHNFVPFEKVAAQYEVNQRICKVEKVLKKQLRYVDSLLLKIGTTRIEVSDHRRRMVHAIANIRDEAEHQQIYHYLTRFEEAAVASGNMFKELTNYLNSFEIHSKARYYRAFGTDCLRPITHTTPDLVLLQPKQEPEPEPAPHAGRDAEFMAFDHLRRVMMRPHRRRANAAAPAPPPPAAGQPGQQPLRQALVGRPFGMILAAEPLEDVLARGGRLGVGVPAPRRNNRREQQMRELLDGLNAAVVQNPELAAIPAVQNVIGWMGNNNRDPPREGEIDDLFEARFALAERQVQHFRANLRRLERDVPPPNLNVPLNIPLDPRPYLRPLPDVDPRRARRALARQLVQRVREQFEFEQGAIVRHNEQPAPGFDEQFLEEIRNNELRIHDIVDLEPFITRLRALEGDFIRRAMEREERLQGEAAEGEQPQGHLDIELRGAEAAVPEPVVPEEGVAGPVAEPAEPEDEPAVKRDRQD